MRGWALVAASYVFVLALLAYAVWQHHTGTGLVSF